MQDEVLFHGYDFLYPFHHCQLFRLYLQVGYITHGIDIIDEIPHESGHPIF